MSDVLSLIEKETGFVIDMKRRNSILAKIKEKAGEKNFTSVKTYAAFLNSPQGSGELQELIDSITVGETYFFRNEKTWNSFREYILPRVYRRAKDDGRRLKLWSAGCSTGEEAYSIAMSVMGHTLSIMEQGLDIFATDINRQSLEKAQTGLYGPHSFRGVPSEIKDRFFTKGKKRYRILESLRQMVAFDRLNLKYWEDIPPRYHHVDVIFCRNVLMYFDPETYGNILAKLSTCLTPEGFLILGHVEGSMAPKDQYQPVKCHGTFVYRKKTGTHTPGPHKKRGIEKPRLHPPPARPVRCKKALAPPPKPLPKDINPYQEALQCYLQENYRAALNHLETQTHAQTEAQHDDIKELILKALLHLNLHQHSDALACLDHLSKLSDLLPEVYMLRAIHKEAEDDLDSAIREGRAAAFADRYFFAPQFYLAHYFDRIGNQKQSRKYFKNALRMIDKDTDDRIKLFFGLVSVDLLKGICERRLTT